MAGSLGFAVIGFQIHPKLVHALVDMGKGGFDFRSFFVCEKRDGTDLLKAFHASGYSVGDMFVGMIRRRQALRGLRNQMPDGVAAKGHLMVERSFGHGLSSTESRFENERIILTTLVHRGNALKLYWLNSNRKKGGVNTLRQTSRIRSVRILDLLRFQSIYYRYFKTS